MPSQEKVDKANESIRTLLASYKMPDWSEVPAQGEVRDLEIVRQLEGLLNNVEPGCYIEFLVDLGKRDDSASEMLYQTISRLSLFPKQETALTLVYRSSEPNSMLPAKSSNSVIDAYYRRVFGKDKVPNHAFADGEPVHEDGSLVWLGIQAVIKVNPTGMPMATIRYESHNIPPYVIKSINVSTEAKYLTAVFDKTTEVCVDTGTFWTRQTAKF